MRDLGARAEKVLAVLSKAHPAWKMIEESLASEALRILDVRWGIPRTVAVGASSLTAMAGGLDLDLGAPT